MERERERERESEGVREREGRRKRKCGVIRERMRRQNTIHQKIKMYPWYL